MDLNIFDGGIHLPQSVVQGSYSLLAPGAKPSLMYGANKSNMTPKVPTSFEFLSMGGPSQQTVRLTGDNVDPFCA